jgi:hypothetical protein
LSCIKSICTVGAVIAWLLMGGALVLAQSAPDAARSARPASEGPDSWDANHDSVYTCEEWKSYLDRLFTLADRNRDGRLDPSEFVTVRRANTTLADADFGYFDENQDGKITRNEFVGKPSEFILANDRNGDCRVTPDEMKAAAATPKSPQNTPVRDRWH